jgi:hypothetical protein
MKKTFSEHKTVNSKVHFLLKENPRLRDNDNELISNFIFKELGEKEVEKMTALDLLAKMSNSKIPFKTIFRARIEIQKNNEALRGESFGKKKKAPKNPLFKVNIREN